jgi:hypothetical protein
MSGNDVVHILAFFERYWELNDGIEITHDMIDAAFTELTSRAWALFDYMNSLDSKIESVIKKRKLGNDFLDTYHKEIYLYKYIMMIIMCIHHGLNKEPKEIGRQRNYLNMEVVNKLNSTAYGDTILISGEPVKLKRVQLVVTYEKNGIETSTSDSNIISFH